jgi:hypothetical protein
MALCGIAEPAFAQAATQQTTDVAAQSAPATADTQDQSGTAKKSA